MNTQETAKINIPQKGNAWADEFRRGLPKLGAAAISALMSLASLPGGYSPFGAAYIAAVTYTCLPSALVGGVVGSLLNGGFFTSFEGLRHLSSLIAVAGIRWALGELKSISRSKPFPFFAAFFGILLTGTVINGTVGSMISYSTLFFVLEGAISGIAAILFSSASEAVSRYDGRISLGKQSFASLLIAVCVALIPVCKFEFLKISPGLILLHAAVMSVIFVKREIGGAVGGIAAGAVTALSGGGLYTAAICPIAALLAGCASYYSRIFSAVVYVSVCFVGCISSGSINYFFLAESIIGAAIACIIPQRHIESALNKMGFIEKMSVRNQKTDNIVIADKLDNAASALTGVSDVVQQVSDQLDKLNAPSIETVYRRSMCSVCKNCACLESCLKNRDSSFGIDSLTDILTKKGSIRGSDISLILGKRCIHEAELAGEINSGYGYHIASQNAHKRIAQVRSVINDQLEGVGMLLSELSDEICDIGRDDEYSAGEISEAIEQCGYNVIEMQCTHSRSGQLRLSISLRPTDSADLELCEIPDFIGEILHCEFYEPKCSELPNGGFKLEMTQRQNFSLSFGSAQHSCDGNKLCGDAYDAFVDGEGNAFMILSDGMGSGGRAAVDGAMACRLLSRLLKAGFGFESAIKIVNSSLLVKSEDESLSTVDGLKINLYNGRAMFCKAGAAQSYHVRDGVVNRIDIQSLPLGILREVDSAQYTLTAEDGDLIVMLSDGVPTDDSMWFEKLLSDYRGESARDFAKLLLNSAVHRRKGGDDDITVIVGRIIAA